MSRKKKQKTDVNEQETQAFGQQANSVFADLFKSNPRNTNTHNQTKLSSSNEANTKKVVHSTQTLTTHNMNTIHKNNQSSKEPLDLESIITQIKSVTVSHSRAKRRGKTVSIMTCKGIDLDPKIHKSFTKILSRSLACRVWIESGDIYVQGDQKERIRQWLKEHAIKHN